MDYGIANHDVVPSGSSPSFIPTDIGNVSLGGQSLRHRKHTQPKSISAIVFLQVQMIAFVIITVIAITMTVVTSGSTARPSADCPSCIVAEEHMSRVVNIKVSPCEDFYQHVCGGAAPIIHGTFEDIVAQVGRRVFTKALLQYPGRTGEKSWTFELISSYYKSCVQDLRTPKDLSFFTSKYAKATGFSWELFDRVNDTPSFLNLIAKMTVEFTLNPGIWIDVRSHILSMGPVGLPSLFSIAELHGLLTTANAYLLRTYSVQEVADIEELHLKILNAIKDSPPRLNSTLENDSSVLADLGLGKAEDWVAAVAKHTIRPLNVSASYWTTVTAPDLFKDILLKIHNHPPRGRSLYLYAYVLQDVIRIAKIGSKAAGQSSLVKKICLNGLEDDYLYGISRAFAIHSMATRRTITSISDIAAEVTLQIVRSISANKHIDPSARVLFSKLLRGYTIPALFAEPLLEVEELNRAYEAFPHVITIYHSKMNLRDALDQDTYQELRRLSHCIKHQNLAVRYERGICVSPYIVVQPMYYVEGRRSYNYGALGFVIASQVIRAFLLDRPKPVEYDDAYKLLLSQVMRCFSGTDIESLDLISSVLGLRSVFNAYRKWAMYSDSEGDHDEAYRVLFRRACLSVCSDNLRHVPYAGDVWNPAQVCNNAVRNMPEFYSAFKCGFGNNMSSGGICAFF